MNAVKSAENAEIHVSGLSQYVDEMTLFETFSKFGKVISIQIKKNICTFDSRGFGFITFALKKQADNAIKESGKIQLYGNYLTISPKGATKIVYVTNFPEGFSDVDIRQMCVQAEIPEFERSFLSQNYRQIENPNISNGIKNETFPPRYEVVFQCQENAVKFCITYNKAVINGCQITCDLKKFTDKQRKKHWENESKLFNEENSKKIIINHLKPGLNEEVIRKELEDLNIKHIVYNSDTSTAELIFSSAKEIQEIFQAGRLDRASLLIFDESNLKNHISYTDDVIYLLKSNYQHKKGPRKYYNQGYGMPDVVYDSRIQMYPGFFPQFMPGPPVHWNPPHQGYVKHNNYHKPYYSGQKNVMIQKTEIGYGELAEKQQIINQKPLEEKKKLARPFIYNQLDRDPGIKKENIQVLVEEIWNYLQGDITKLVNFLNRKDRTYYNEVMNDVHGKLKNQLIHFKKEKYKKFFFWFLNNLYLVTYSKFLHF